MSSQSANMTTHNYNPTLLNLTSTPIPPQLKFIIQGIKSTIKTQLNPETYLTWKSQILKLFAANGFEGFLTGTTPKPPSHLLTADDTSQPNTDHSLWLLIDQNLSAALYSTISSTLLPYVLNLETCQDIWQTITHHLQSTNRSKVSQLKNELYTLSMGDLTMTQYLSLLKSKIDALAAAGSTLDNEDIIHYTLNGLSPAYHSFKSAIRTSLQPIRLDDFYSLLCSEETNLTVEHQKELLHHTLHSSNSHTTLYSYRGRGRGRTNFSIGRSQTSSSPNQTYQSPKSRDTTTPLPHVRFPTNVATPPTNAGIAATSTVSPPLQPPLNMHLPPTASPLHQVGFSTPAPPRTSHSTQLNFITPNPIKAFNL